MNRENAADLRLQVSCDTSGAVHFGKSEAKKDPRARVGLGLEPPHPGAGSWLPGVFLAGTVEWQRDS